jgi:hypothetical protein
LILAVEKKQTAKLVCAELSHCTFKQERKAAALIT